MNRLTKQQVLAVHEALVRAYGGNLGVIDEGLLDSALQAPFQTFDGKDLLPTMQQKASRLCYGLIKNHPFADGNKRTGAHVMLLFLQMNHIFLQYSQQELIDIIFRVTAGEADAEALLQWLLDHEV